MSGDKIQNVDQLISDAVNKNNVVVFSKTYCGFCAKVS